MTNSVIKLKKSSVAGRVPADSSLEYGEVALNFNDGRLFYKNSSNTISNFVDSDLMVSTIDTKISAIGGLDSDTVTTLASEQAIVFAIALG